MLDIAVCRYTGPQYLRIPNDHDHPIIIQSVEEYHQSVYKPLSLILNRTGCMDVSEESQPLMTKMYRDKALDKFIRGLRGDLSRLLEIRDPTDLPSALHLCLKNPKLPETNFRNNLQKPIPTPRANCTKSFRQQP